VVTRIEGRTDPRESSDNPAAQILVAGDAWTATDDLLSAGYAVPSHPSTG
jgi:hypothetical protein